MLIGALLLVTWVILLIRYPVRAIPISLGALLGLGLVAAWVVWQEQREEHLLAQLELRLVYAPAICPAAQPLRITLDNHSSRALQSLRWDVAAYSPGGSLNLVTSNYDAPDTAALATCSPVSAGSPVRRCRRCVRAIAAVAWSFAPSGFRDISTTELAN